MIDTLPKGWLSDAEAAALAEHAAGKIVLEIGSYLGRSTVAMGRTAKVVVAIDHHQGPPQDGTGSTLARFIVNLAEFKVADKVVPIISGFERAAPYLLPLFDLAFIDAAHDGLSVLRDAGYAAKLLKPGGLLLFHDYDVHHGVNSAVHELEARWKVTHALIADTSIAVLAL